MSKFEVRPKPIEAAPPPKTFLVLDRFIDPAHMDSLEIDTSKLSPKSAKKALEIKLKILDWGKNVEKASLEGMGNLLTAMVLGDIADINKGTDLFDILTSLVVTNMIYCLSKGYKASQKRDSLIHQLETLVHTKNIDPTLINADLTLPPYLQRITGSKINRKILTVDPTYIVRT